MIIKRARSKGVFFWISMILIVFTFLLNACSSKVHEPAVSTSTPTTTNPLNVASPLFTHLVGQGTLIETGFSPLNSRYRIWNSWHATINNLEYGVYAGGYRKEQEGNSISIALDTSWPGIVVVRVSDGHGKFFPEKGGEFLSPQNKGPIRILDEKDNILTLASRDGSVFSFDLGRLEFLPSTTETLFSRSMGKGLLVESGVPPFFMYQYEWVNQFMLPEEGGFTRYYLAGRLRDNPKQGLFMVLGVSQKDSSMWEGVAFLSPYQDGALRIVAGSMNQLTVVSEDGVVYSFDIAADKFTSISEGGTIASVPVVLSPVFEAEITATITPTPGPTRTALPTYAPYP